MISPKRVFLAGCFAFSLAVPAFGAEPYITAKMIDVATLMPPPPAKGSPADIVDLRAVLDAEAHASEARKAQSLVDSGETVYVMFTGVMGMQFVPADLPKTSKLFERIGASEGATVGAAKRMFGRERPWIASPEVKAYAKPSRSPSYSSGHTTRVTIDAIVLSAMVPEKQREIWDRAEDYAESRIIGGMHYPTDVQAGWCTGTALAALMFEQENFRADFDAAKAELRATLGLSATAAN